VLKLLKYNWKMNSLSVYIILASTALLYILMLVGKYNWGWMDEVTFSLGTFVAMLSSMLFIVITCLSYKHQLKSYHRRLLPLSQIEEIASILLLGVIYMLLAIVPSIVYFVVLDAEFNYEAINAALDIVLQPKPIISMLLYSAWVTLMLLTLIMLAMTVTYSFRGKYRAWIGVAVFIGISIVIDYVANLIAGPNYEMQYGFIMFDLSSNDVTIKEGMSIDWFHFWSMSMLIDVIVLALMITMIHYLLKKRVQL